jgi:hypothetical protein
MLCREKQVFGMSRTHKQTANPPAPNLAHFYEHGDVYDALDALDDLRLVVARLKRQGRLSAGEQHLLAESLTAVDAVLSRKIGGSEIPTAGFSDDAPLLDA